MKEEIDKYTNVYGDFDTGISVIDRRIRTEMNMNIESRNDTVPSLN